MSERSAPAIPGRDSKWPVAVLGATGAVGQTFVRLLDGHPWFELTEVAASERSLGKSYREAARWLEGSIPESVARMKLRSCDPADISAPIVFSALGSDVAGEIETAFARAGRFVLSNAKNFRMDADVPLVIPEVNADHLALIPAQRGQRGWTGAIVTNPNCSTVVLSMALAPLRRFGLRSVLVTTLQAVSGAGYPGVPSLDILGNVVPGIAGEEEKIESETQKILGTLQAGTLAPHPVVVSAQTTRVPVVDGHTETIAVSLEKTPSIEEVIHALRSFRGRPQELGLPSAPADPIVWLDAPDRPQPRLDAERGGGMTVTVGRVRACPVQGVKFVALGHNTIRGAAGAAVLNAELMQADGWLQRT